METAVTCRMHRLWQVRSARPGDNLHRLQRRALAVVGSIDRPEKVAMPAACLVTVCTDRASCRRSHSLAQDSGCWCNGGFFSTGAEVYSVLYPLPYRCQTLTLSNRHSFCDDDDGRAGHACRCGRRISRRFRASCPSSCAMMIAGDSSQPLVDGSSLRVLRGRPCRGSFQPLDSTLEVPALPF